ncbi:MAG: 23S rRNA (adenine(2503)-C(2))-methyltransferase RlmN [Mariprofundaceae bacterium]
MQTQSLPQLPGLTHDELLALMRDWRLPAYRGKQLLQWRNLGVLNPELMSNLPPSLRQQLPKLLDCQPLTLAERQLSTDGTRKYLFRLGSGKSLETVFIPEAERGTVCVSTQVGCVFDCPFCHTGTQRFDGNLSSGEIVAQVLAVKHDLNEEPSTADLSSTVSHIVYMGMGEPLANEKGVHASLTLLMDPAGLGLSRRRITVSTSGLVPAIKRLGDAFPVNLAVSLHAATDALRDELVPINRKHPLAELRACLDAYTLGKQRHITLEYVMLDGVNDRDADLDALARFARAGRERVNLICFNPYPGSPYRGSSTDRIESAAQNLINLGIRATVRRSRGGDIMAACGQLRAEAA